MCDIYGHKCLLCEEIVSMHLGDFNTGRNEINIICHKHRFLELQSYLENSVLWFISSHPLSHLYDGDQEDGGYNWQRSKEVAEEYGGKCVLVQALTENAVANKDHNSPNLLINDVPIEGSWFLTKGESSA